MELSERGGAWSRLENGQRSVPADRQDLMTARSNVEVILIRTTFSDRMQSTFLRNVVLDTAIPANTQQDLARGIEQCCCPTEYNGLSCEDCAAHHYRVSTDPSSAWPQCPCNGNDESCFLSPDRRVQCRRWPRFTGHYCQTEVGGSGNGTVHPPTTSVTISDPIVVAKVGECTTLFCSARSLTGDQMFAAGTNSLACRTAPWTTERACW